MAKRKKVARKSGGRKGVKAWSSAEVGRLRTAYKTTTVTRIAKALGRTLSSVKSKARALKLYKGGPGGGKKAGRRR